MLTFYSGLLTKNDRCLDNIATNIEDSSAKVLNIHMSDRQYAQVLDNKIGKNNEKFEITKITLISSSHCENLKIGHNSITVAEHEIQHIFSNI